jgi:5-methylcytosine-specific restriction enzyme subunit McrC
MTQEVQSNLFEYQNKIPLSNFNKFNRDEFLCFLNKVWQVREQSIYFRNQPKEEEEVENESDIDSDLKKEQQFISFLSDNSIKARNYVGVIHYEGITFNLLPKIFYLEYESINKKEEYKDEREIHLNKIQQNILWWLSYSKRLKFPKLESSYNKIKTKSFFEILIYLFSNYTRELLTKQIYQHYSEIDRELSFLKGRISMNSYIKDNLCNGNWSKISCTYDSFEIDNQLNRIIKYVSKLLLQNTKNSNNKQALRKIIFTLDEVADIQIIATDCEKVKINPLFSEMQTVLDYCKLFLTNSMVYTWKNELKVFAFLIPMEKIFEEFIFGFIEKHQSEIFINKNYKVNSQSSNGKSLDQGNKYKLIHDILIKNGDIVEYIVDTKYKLAYSKEKGKDFRPSQVDMYQMVSYAIRQKCVGVKLFYPKSNENKIVCNQQNYIVKDELSNSDINIKVYNLPVITDIIDGIAEERYLKHCLKCIFSEEEIK